MRGTLYLLTCPRHIEFVTSDEATARSCDRALKAEGADFSMWRQGPSYCGVARIAGNNWTGLACEIAFRGVHVIRTEFHGEGMPLPEANLVRQGTRLTLPVPQQEEAFLKLMRFEFGAVEVVEGSGA